MNSAGTAVVTYAYDAWGNILSMSDDSGVNLGKLNPLRYRGYVYDQESGLYYLQSRYYSPETGRFINADALVSTGQGILGNNMFAYCGNSPISYSDPSGCYQTDTSVRPLLYGGGGKSNNVIVYPRDSHDQIEGLINGQGIFEFAGEGIGFGSYASSGCTYIGIYNALQLLGCPQSLGSIRDEFLYELGTLFWGAAGAAPWQFDEYFDKHNISYTGYGKYDDLIANLQDGDVIVFTIQNNIWNPFMYHTMAAQYQNGYFIVYNVSNKRDSSYSTASLLNMYAAGPSRWIYGYNLGG